VLLKRLEERSPTATTSMAVIKGSRSTTTVRIRSATTAPSVNGQAEVILEAQAIAGVHPDSITYVEAHVPARFSADPIEIGPDTGFRTRTERHPVLRHRFCESNIGHLDHRRGHFRLDQGHHDGRARADPPSLHFKTPNPKLNLEQTPFFVKHRAARLDPPPGVPRRAAVSSSVSGAPMHIPFWSSRRAVRHQLRAGMHAVAVLGRSDAALKSNVSQLRAPSATVSRLNIADARVYVAGRPAGRSNIGPMSP